MENEEGKKNLPLRGIKVLELAGLAPVPFCGLILADFGADVIRVDRVGAPSTDNLSRGKRSISLNLKLKEGVDTFKQLSRHVDVVIDPYRPGVMEKMGLDPIDLLKENERLIVARLTGFGQKGPLSHLAGHDINYLSISASLSLSSGPKKPEFPSNILGDFAGGGSFCAMGILLAIIDRSLSGKGQIIDAAMIDGCNYLNTFVYANKSSIFSSPRAQNILDGGAPFYGVYETKDGKFISLGALEKQFYNLFVKLINLQDDPIIASGRSDPSNWPYLRSTFQQTFLSKTQLEWREIFEKTDACVQAVVDSNDFAEFHNTKERQMMFKQKDLCGDEIDMPSPAPRLSRSSPSLSHLSSKSLPLPGDHSLSVLRQFNFTFDEILHLSNINAIELSPADHSLLTSSPSSKL